MADFLRNNIKKSEVATTARFLLTNDLPDCTILEIAFRIKHKSHPPKAIVDNKFYICFIVERGESKWKNL